LEIEVRLENQKLMDTNVLLIEIGGTTTRLARFDLVNEMIDGIIRFETPNYLTRPHSSPDALLAELIEQIGQQSHNIPNLLVPEFVIAAYPGPVSASGLAARSPTIFGTECRDSFDIRRNIQGLWPSAQIHVLNDLTCSGYFFLHHGHRDFCVLTVGSGIGNKVFLNGLPKVGSSGYYGEIGHLKLTPRSNIVLSGIPRELGELASGRGTVWLAQYWYENFPNDFLDSVLAKEMFSRSGESTGGKALVHAFHSNDLMAHRVVEAAASPLAVTLASMHLGLGIEKFFIVGGFAKALGPKYCAILSRLMQEAAWDVGQSWDSMIELGQDGVEEGLLGAGYFAKSQIKQDGAGMLFRTSLSKPLQQEVTSADRLKQRFKDGHFTVGIIGLGAVGTATAKLAAEAGLGVIGYDCDPERVRIVEGELSRYGCEICSQSNRLAVTDVVVIAVRAAVEPNGNVNTNAVSAALGIIREWPDAARLIVLETTLPPGMSRRLVSEYLNDSFALVAYCPERLRAGDKSEAIRSVPRLVGGFSSESSEIACAFFERVGVSAVVVSHPEVAELSKLFENTFLTTGIALMGEITRIAHAFGIDASEVAKAAATKPHGYFPFYPGAGIGGHCLLNDLNLLRRAAFDRKLNSPMLDGVAKAVTYLTPTVVHRLSSLMIASGSNLKGALVWLIGVGFKVGSNDTTGSAANEIIRLLRKMGADVVYSDSQVNTLMVDGLPVNRISLPNIPNIIDAAVILSGDRLIELRDVVGLAPIVLDAGGSRIMKGNESAIILL
jgi:nucleotide sugar dehydrogenase